MDSKPTLPNLEGMMTSLRSEKSQFGRRLLGRTTRAFRTLLQGDRLKDSDWKLPSAIAEIDVETLASMRKSEIKQLPIDYSTDLAMDRVLLSEALSDCGEPTFDACIRRQFHEFFQDSNVLEIGPGFPDYLYKIFQDARLHESGCGKWTSLEINPVVAAALDATSYSRTGYRALEGDAADLSCFQDKSFDVICGLCSFDSIIDFETVIPEVNRVIKPGGHFIHIQDAAPAESTLARLINLDPEMQRSTPITIKMTRRNVIAMLQLPGQPPVYTGHYLHIGMEREFQKNGFKTVEMAINEYNKVILLENYSYLVMQKVGS